MSSPISPSTEQAVITPLVGPAKDFTDFCEAEFERRRNSDETFDENSHRAAMELVLKKLDRLIGGTAQ